MTTAATIEETVDNMKEAISLHLEAMADLGVPIPQPAAESDIPADRAVILRVEIAA